MSIQSVTRFTAILLGLVLLLALGSGGASGRNVKVAASPATDEFTPVVALAHTAEATPVPGSDGAWHVVYELRLTNVRAIEATVLKVEVLDASRSQQVVATVDGASLTRSLRTLDNKPAEQPLIAANTSRMLMMHLTFAKRDDIPAHLIHRFTVRAGGIDSSNPDAVEQRYGSAPIILSPKPPVVLGPPLKGLGWIVINGCCEPDSVHRPSALPVNGDIRFAQRFAIDYMRLNTKGMLVDGNGSQPSQYAAYGADVLAVADGVVVAVLDSLDDQIPPNLPAPSTITLNNADGNHLVIKLGEGLFAFYAHLQKGKGGVKVGLGDTVRRGQVIGVLGNSGNSSAPHLHFHVMDGPSVLGSNGLPFVIDGYRQTGQASDAIASTAGLFSNFGQGRSGAAVSRRASMPLDFAIVEFP